MNNNRIRSFRASHPYRGLSEIRFTNLRFHLRHSAQH